ncbi:MAG: hypothetical protein QOF76_1847 [Solirubrobacteraceae bacterium]|jgi:hypothetical protein|nr:hypothetical protein [Solirubrobacteraceae bacterium]
MTAPDYPPPPPGAPGEQDAIDPQRMANLTAEWMSSAGHDQQLGQRLALAATRVHVHFTDEVGCTFILDETPIRAENTIVGDAEVQLWGSADLFYDLIRRKHQMAMSIMRGELKYRGPVRKFLRIVPILRSIDFAPYRDIHTNGNGS